jgi:hypothetical protein
VTATAIICGNSTAKKENIYGGKGKDFFGPKRTIWKRRNKEEERKREKNKRKGLIFTGLLMEGNGTSS